MSIKQYASFYCKRQSRMSDPLWLPNKRVSHSECAIFMSSLHQSVPVRSRDHWPTWFSIPPSSRDASRWEIVTDYDCTLMHARDRTHVTRRTWPNTRDQMDGIKCSWLKIETWMLLREKGLKWLLWNGIGRSRWMMWRCVRVSGIKRRCLHDIFRCAIAPL